MDYKIHKVDPYERQPDYKTDCMNGSPHPLATPTFIYTRITIGHTDVDSGQESSSAHYHWHKGDNWSQSDADVIRSFIERPEVDWALNNSLDGLYVKKVMRPDNWSTHYKFEAYLKEEHITFWKLKF